MRRFLPTFQDLALLMPPGFLFLRMDGFRTLLGDGDTGWHIRTGDWILDNGRVPHQDLFSFTRPEAPWYAWEWLWDLGAALLHRVGGLGLVALSSLILLSLTFALLFRVVVRRSGNPVLAIALMFAVAVTSCVHWLARPHLFTLFFLVVFLAVLERVRAGRLAWLWCLPAITIVWVNLHGGFFVGAAVVVLYAAGELLSTALAPERGTRRTHLRQAALYAATAMGCFAASFVNPYGWGLHAHVIEYLREPFHVQNIDEFKSFSFHHPLALYFEALLGLGLLCALWQAWRKRFAEALLILMWAHLALFAVRNVPLFAVAVAFVGGQAIQEMLVAACRSLEPRLRGIARGAYWFSRDMARVDQGGAALPVCGTVALCVLAAVTPALPADFDPTSYPEKALPVIERGAGRVFTHDEWGDYLIYRLYPHLKVYVDGRSDFYGGAFGNTYLGILKVKHGWEDVLRSYDVETVLLPVDAPLSGALKISPRWRVVFDDGRAIVFRRERDLMSLRPSACRPIAP
jgi:hypothetical protein